MVIFFPISSPILGFSITKNEDNDNVLSFLQKMWEKQTNKQKSVYFKAEHFVMEKFLLHA